MTGTEESTMFCSNCRAVIPVEMTYCTKCGAEQTINSDNVENLEPEFLPADEKYCGHCGEAIKKGVAYCGHCGGAINSVDDARNDEPISEWLIGFSPDDKKQNVIAGVFLYFLLYPIGVPLLLYSYLHKKRGWTKSIVISLAIVIAIVLFITVLIV